MTSVAGDLTVLAMDGVSLIGTIGFFGPAAVVVALVVGAVVRDRRRASEEDVDTTV